MVNSFTVDRLTPGEEYSATEHAMDGLLDNLRQVADYEHVSLGDCEEMTRERGAAYRSERGEMLRVRRCLNDRGFYEVDGPDA
jgi:hypothetical protein